MKRGMRMLALILSIVLALGLLPGIALAEETGTATQAGEEVVTEKPPISWQRTKELV